MTTQTFDPSKQGLGWIPDLPDHRDLLFADSRLAAPPLILPSSDLRKTSFLHPVMDQGNMGSCTGHGVKEAMWFDQIKQGKSPEFEPSRLFIYWNGRAIENSTASDSGAAIRDVVKGVVTYGVCPESAWAYTESNLLVRPPFGLFEKAKHHKALQYNRLNGLMDMRACLSSGYGFVFGFSVFDSFMSDAVAKTGMVPMPSKKESNQGGHCVFGVGHDDSTELITCENSWGLNWGDAGFFYLPYDYITALAGDIWVISEIA